MSVFAIYHVNLIEPKEPKFHVQENPQTKEEYRLCFEKLISKASIPVNKVNRDKTTSPLDCTAQQHFNNVHLFLLNNEKNFKHFEGKEKDTFTYHPGCYIIFDNRPEKALLAIERTPAFDSNTDKVRDLLVNAFASLCYQINMSVELRARFHEGEFWNIIEELKQFGDQINKVSFEFPNPDKVKSIETTMDMNAKLSVLASLTTTMNAAKGILNMEASKDSMLRFEQTQEDLAQMVHLCCNNGYRIAVRFRGYGVYRYGKKVKAFGEISDDSISEFIKQTTILGKSIECEYDLINWLDNLHNSDNLFVDE